MPGMRSVPLGEVNGCLAGMPVKYQALAAIGVTTGCRITEILNLQRSDLLTPDGALKERIAFDKLKTRTGVKHRFFAIPGPYRPYVTRHLRREEEKGYDRPDDLVFRGKNGRPLSRSSAYNFFRAQMGNGYGTHWMRKTFAQEMFRWFLRERPDDPMRALELTRQCLGHARIDTTVKYLGIQDAEISQAQAAVFSA